MLQFVPKLKNTVGLGQKFFFSNKCLKIQIKCFAAPSTATATSIIAEPKWQLVAAACITRSPVISPSMSLMEQKYANFLEKIEVEQSLKSDHELRIIEDQLRSELLNAGEIKDINMDEASKETAAEFEDKSNAELKSFEFAPKITEVDEARELSSLNRSLDRALVLTVKQKLGLQHQRIFPQTPWEPGETLRQSCERVIRNVCGAKVKAKVLGNSPCGFFKYKYPKEVRKEGFIGAKVFFFSAHVTAYDLEGLDNSEEFCEHQWLTQDELESCLNKSYYQAVSKFLISDK